MYVSIRDASIIDAGYSSIKEGLEALGLSVIEADYSREPDLVAIDDNNKRFSVATDADIDIYAAHLKEHGVKISALLLANDLNAEDLDAEHVWMKQACRVAYRLGAPAVRIDSAMTGQQELPFEERVGKFVTGIKRIIAETPDTPVDLGIENHGYQGNDPEFLHGVFGGVGSDRIGMTLDTGNFYWRGHPMTKTLAVIDEFAKLAKHTHVKNINYPEDKRDVEREMGWEYGTYVSPIYEGDIDHSKVIASLKKAGYDRDLCIEDESLGKFTEAERKVILKKDAEHLLALVG
jgi:sugar phosphate isomerase/epimerase